MRFPVERSRARSARIAIALILAAPAGACVSASDSVDKTPAALANPNGPAADYPMVIGAPYSVAGKLYTPEDVMNYDEVGVAVAESGAAKGVTAAHHTLPLPSYVEVTSLDTGRTILVRVEQRGPMDNTALIALSPAAFAQLDATAGVPVRVRRVNPPEEQRAALRAGGTAPMRMDTPMSLVAILKRKLNPEGVTAPLASAQVPQPIEPKPVPAPVPPPSPPAPPQSFTKAFDTAPATKPIAPNPEPDRVAEVEGRFIVQAAAFSTAERADRAAASLGGKVSRSGRFFRVRTGPFVTRGQAEASLAKVKAAGYTDARIYTDG